MKGRIFSHGKILAIISVSAVTLFVSVLLLQSSLVAEDLEYAGISKAAIIDQLSDEIPNEYFHQDAKYYLEAAGYQVDLFTTENVTVDLYKRLPAMNYKFIVIRSHAAVDKIKENPVTLFTGERYQTDKYIQEQLLGQVKRGSPLLEREFQASVQNSSEWIIVNETYRTITTPAIEIDNPGEEFFLITPKFIDESMVGKFPASVIVLGGCSTLSNPSMAHALIKRGASSVVGWNDFVDSSNNDSAILKFLEETLMNNQKIEGAVDSVMKNYNHDPKYPATFEYYENNM